MIISSLTRTCTDPSGRFLMVPDHIADTLQLKKETTLYAYANSEDKELYLSPSSIDLPIGAVTVLGANKPGVIAAIGTTFGKQSMNIVHCSSFALGGFGITELIFECQLTSEDKGEFAAKCAAVSQDLESLEEYVTDAVIQPLYRIIPVPLIQNPVVIRTVGGNIPLDPLPIAQLGLEQTNEYAALMTAYVRFPMLIARFFLHPDQVVRIRANVANKPNVLGSIAESIRDKVNVFSSTFLYLEPRIDTQHVGMTLYGDLLREMTKQNVEEALLSVNREAGKSIISEGSIICQLVSEIVESGTYE